RAAEPQGEGLTQATVRRSLTARRAPEPQGEGAHSKFFHTFYADRGSRSGPMLLQSRSFPGGVQNQAAQVQSQARYRAGRSLSEGQLGVQGFDEEAGLRLWKQLNRRQPCGLGQQLVSITGDCDHELRAEAVAANVAVIDSRIDADCDLLFWHIDGVA